LAYQAVSQIPRSFAQAAERGRQAIELARRHGWTDEVAAGHAYAALATVLAWQGRLDEAAAWVQRAGRTIKSEAQPAAAMMVCYEHMVLELAHGRDADAVAAFRAAERLAGAWARRTCSSRRCRHCCCPPWCASARPNGPGTSWPASASTTAT